MSADWTLTVPVTCDVHISWGLRYPQWKLPLPQIEHDIGHLDVRVVNQKEMLRLTARTCRPGGYVIDMGRWGMRRPHKSVRDMMDRAFAQVEGNIRSAIKQAQVDSLTEWLRRQGWGWRREGDDIVAAKGAPAEGLDELARYLLDPPDNWHGQVRVEGGR